MKTSRNTPIARAAIAVGGITSLATAIGQKQSTVSMWKKRGRVPSEHCISIEKATNGLITRYELRPDVFGEKASAA